MAILFAKLIEKKLKTFEQVPVLLQPDVHIALSKDGYDDNSDKLPTT